jgi:hypothetical protein
MPYSPSIKTGSLEFLRLKLVWDWMSQIALLRRRPAGWPLVLAELCKRIAVAASIVMKRYEKLRTIIKNCDKKRQELMNKG